MGRGHKLTLLVKDKTRGADGKKKSKTQVPGQIFPSAWTLMRKQKALRKKIGAMQKADEDTRRD